MKTKIIVIAFIFFLPLSALFSQREVYLFSYFRGNGEDGLHLAWSRDGLKWTALNGGRPFFKPEAGISKLMRDPCIIRTPDGIFHMVWTTGWTEKGIGYAWSEDLIQWHEQKYIEVMAHEPGARNCWAPELFYDREKKQFLIFWSTTITGRFTETEVAGESRYNHRIYFTTTKDFKTFTGTELFYDPGFNVIDATILKNGKQYIMFFKDETVEPPRKNIKIAFSSTPYGPWSKASDPITGRYWAEGPSAIKAGRKYIVYFDRYREGKYGAVTSVDLKNWEEISDLVEFPGGARHGTVFKIPSDVLKKLFSGDKL